MRFLNWALSLKEVNKEKILQFIWHLFGNLFPLILGLIIFALPDIKWLGAKAFIQDGQFYIYSVTLLASALYIFWSFKIENLDRFALLSYGSVAIGGLTSLFYAFLLVGVINDYDTISSTSLIAFALSVFIYYKSIVINPQVDVQKIQRDKIQEIAANLG